MRRLTGIAVTLATAVGIGAVTLLGEVIKGEDPAAQASRVSAQEIGEAIVTAALVRHWSTVLNSLQIDPAAFKHETDTVLRFAGEKATTTHGKPQ